MNNINNLIEQAKNKFDLRDYKGAIELIDRIIELNPDVPGAFINRGLAKYELLDYEGAIEDYTQAIKLNLNFPEAFIKRGCAKEELQDYKGAIEDYTQAIKLNQDYKEAFFHRGGAKQVLQDYKGAIEDYTQAIKLNQDFNEAFYNRGLANSKLKAYKGAIEDYTQAIKLSPNFPQAFNNRGLAKEELLDYQEAIDDYTQAIKLSPNFPLPFNNRGNAKLNLKDYKGAIEDYTQAIKLSPNFPLPFNNRGLAKSNLKDNIGAIEDFTKAINLTSDYAEAYYNRGVTKDELKDYPEALEDYTQAIKINFKKNKRKEDIKRILKFRPVNTETIQSITNKEIWFSHPKKFNDPLDANFIQSYIKFNSKTEALTIILNNFLVSSFVDELDSYKDGLLEEDNNPVDYSLLMWAHYCENHTGICLIYEFMNDEDKENKFCIDQIKYLEKIIKPDFKDVNSIIKEGFFTKYKIWEYEHEIRILYLLENNKENACINGIAIDLEEVGLELKEIIFGYKCSENDKFLIRKLFEKQTSNEYPHFYQMEENIDNNYFKLIKTRVG